jgi:hypothetical protein
MGYVHAHQGTPTIEECGSPNHVQSNGEKNGEDKQKVGKTSPIISQMATPRLEHHKI